MKRFLIVGAVALLAGEQALAADLSPPAPMPRAPAVYVPQLIPVYNWTGFYVGGNLGGSWQQGSFSDPFGNNFSTNNQFVGTGGGQVGVNYEFNSGAVVGAEAMFDWRFNNGNTSNTVGLANATGVIAPPINGSITVTISG
jgi:outer membrane immunogenic protein